jgi:hypothetical protein
MEPQIKLLSYRKRQSFFWLLLTIFLVSLPIFIFYTSGYRLSFENEETTIVTTGGIYITTGNLEVDVYLDEEQVDRPRLFRSAYYIQNIEKGSHRLVVQGEGLNTWVKELPVDSYIVTEVAAFNMPVIPQVRPIPEFRTAAGVGIFIEKSTSTNLFTQGTTTEAFLVTTNTATSTPLWKVSLQRRLVRVLLPPLLLPIELKRKLNVFNLRLGQYPLQLQPRSLSSEIT